MDMLPLRTGRALPSVGFGLWKLEPEIAPEMIVSAAEAGYRHFDSASDYGNEVEVGRGLKKATDQGICSRDELWVTSKLWNNYHRAEHVRPALLRTLSDLQLDYLDLYLIHFPIALKFVPFDVRYPAGWFGDPDAEQPTMDLDSVSVQETWQAMEELISEGLVRDIGVCNFGCAGLRDLMSYASVPPAVLQVELHPYLTQEKLLRFCQSEQIAVTGFSPLGALSYFALGMADTEESVIETETVKSIAASQGRTTAQVVLRWAVQRGTAIIPKTSRPERLAENMAIFDFALTTEEMAAISALDRNRRFNDPGHFCEAAFNTFCPIYE